MGFSCQDVTLFKTTTNDMLHIYRKESEVETKNRNKKKTNNIFITKKNKKSNCDLGPFRSRSNCDQSSNHIPTL